MGWFVFIFIEKQKFIDHFNASVILTNDIFSSQLLLYLLVVFVIIKLTQIRFLGVYNENSKIFVELIFPFHYSVLLI